MFLHFFFGFIYLIVIIDIAFSAIKKIESNFNIIIKKNLIPNKIK